MSDFSSIDYDGVGNRTSIDASIPGATALSGGTSYQYDSKDQITQETSTRNGGFTDNFGYDFAGNPTSFKGANKSYNSNNQQTGTGFVHDGNGNPATYAGTTLTFDPENRMTAYGSVLTGGYTGDGLRAWKENSGGRMYFVYDGIVPVMELDSSGAFAATNTFGANGLVSRREGSTSIFYSFDSEGNVAGRTDLSGSVLSNHHFSAHGTVLGSSQSDPFGYRGMFGYYTDHESGLLFLTHRYYDPSTGRFLTRDPVSYNGGINLYGYVANAPTTRIDPSGLSGVTKAARIVKLLFGGGMKIERSVGFEEATRAVKNGGDVIADNRRAANEIARTAGDGKRPIHDPAHGPLREGYRPHYHPAGRPGGHVFYGIAVILAPHSMTLSERSCTTNAQFASAVAWDLASSVDPVGLTDLIDWAVGLD